ncbi:hypothetical protein QFC21_003507 [Naganishia friedmannii]|uniref:Uncharacterized protein n=1 Tax=Naganishia friedmannii TaxID=89922 RepID=A0ACC2VMT9_9TREE|nr:hypothetical protein QFC21_003507 [Naganishia friedmannii]
MSRSTGLIPPFPSSSSSSPQQHQHQPSSSNNPFLSPAPSPSHQHQQPLSYGPRAISPAPGGAISRQSSMESMHSGRGGGGGGYGAASPMLYSTHQPLLYSGSAGQVGSMSTLGGGGGGKNGEKGDVMGYPSSPSTDPSSWGADVSSAFAEPDDYLHNPDPKRDRKTDRGGSIFTLRGLANVGCLLFLCLAMTVLFAGYPIISAYKADHPTTLGAYNLGGINSTGQVAAVIGDFGLIDKDTPQDVYTRTGFDGSAYSLAFSDEFNTDGRTFFPGDDPYWEGVDLHYWPTNDFEWYDPSAITTRNGNLVITMTQEPIHDLNFKSGMIQSWNKVCFSGGVYIEVSVSLPGNNYIGGFWPGVWTFGNLGRAGHGATTEGMWPYTYDTCDIGTLPNQTYHNGTGPDATLHSNNGESVSFLPGQRLSRCTCGNNPDHPGPKLSDGSYRGRSSPEIDLIEAQINTDHSKGEMSQSLQLAPFDAGYWPFNTSSDYTQYDSSITRWNSYRGGNLQQAVSSLTWVPDGVYQNTSQQFNTYGMEWYANTNDRDNGYVAWIASGVRSWTVHASAMAPNPATEIGQRIIPEEPMYLIMNFGMSNNFQSVAFAQLDFPNEMHVDYIRVYTKDGFGTVGCDPPDYPTANPNLTLWSDAGYSFPPNKLKLRHLY